MICEISKALMAYSFVPNHWFGDYLGNAIRGLDLEVKTRQLRRRKNGGTEGAFPFIM